MLTSPILLVPEGHHDLDGDHEICVRVLDDDDAQVVGATFGWSSRIQLPKVFLCHPFHWPSQHNVAHLKNMGQHRVVIELDGNQIEVP